MLQETDRPRIVERIVIAKFDGDPPKPGEDKQPVEVIVIDHRGEDPCPLRDSGKAR